MGCEGLCDLVAIRISSLPSTFFLALCSSHFGFLLVFYMYPNSSCLRTFAHTVPAPHCLIFSLHNNGLHSFQMVAQSHVYAETKDPS